MIKRLSLGSIGIALITCISRVIAASNQTITATDIDQVEAIALRACAASGYVRQSIEGQNWTRSVKFRIKAVREGCLHVKAFRTMPDPFEFDLMVWKHNGKWEIQPLHLDWRADK